MSNNVQKKYVMTYEADVKSYVDGVEKITTTTRRMALNSKQSAAEVEAAVSKAGGKNVRVYEETATTLARTVKAQIAENEKLANSAKKTSARIVAANDEVYRSSTNASRGYRGVMQSAGYQMQDVLVQAQQGTNAFMILSQQGSQFASAFGPGGAVVGALIATAGMLGMVATSGDEAASALENLEEKYKDMSEAAKELALNELNNQIGDQYTELGELEATLDSATKKYEAYKRAISGQGQGSLDFLVSEKNVAAARSAMLEAEVALENQKKLVGELTQKRQLLASTPFIDPGQSEVYTEEYKQRKSLLESMTTSMEKQTRTIEQEYEYRKGIIDSFVLQEDQAARHYGALERWKTQELQKEADKRDKERQAEVAKSLAWQERALRDAARIAKQREDMLADLESSSSPTLSAEDAENARHAETMNKAIMMRSQLKQWEYADRARLNKIIESEEKRHADALEAIQKAKVAAAEAEYMSIAESTASTLGMIASAGDEMNSLQKGLFVMSQLITGSMMAVRAFDTASIAQNTVTEATGSATAGAAAYTASLTAGFAQIGAMMGISFAGAFDKGGNIPNGSMGVVSEFGDELIGGTLVYNQSGGPLNVTGREKTAELLGNGDSANSGGGNTIIHQNITVNGSGDKALISAMKKAAEDGAKQGYAMVSKDFNTDRGISKYAARRR